MNDNLIMMKAFIRNDKILHKIMYRAYMGYKKISKENVVERRRYFDKVRNDIEVYIDKCAKNNSNEYDALRMSFPILVRVTSDTITKNNRLDINISYKNGSSMINIVPNV